MLVCIIVVIVISAEGTWIQTGRLGSTKLRAHNIAISRFEEHPLRPPVSSPPTSSLRFAWFHARRGRLRQEASAKGTHPDRARPAQGVRCPIVLLVRRRRRTLLTGHLAFSSCSHSWSGHQRPHRRRRPSSGCPLHEPLENGFQVGFFFCADTVAAHLAIPDGFQI
jgi:hypothetical protein